jgi:hypothetical protein
MIYLTKSLLALAALSFVLAVVASQFTGPISGLGPWGLSTACTNLALLAIAAHLVLKPVPVD